MTINNQNRAAWIKLFYYVFIFLYLAVSIILIYLKAKPIYPIFGAIRGFVFACIALSLSLNLNYIIYQESEEKIILRYYPLHPFHQKFKSIEILKSQFSHFNLKRKLFGLRPEVTLYQQTERGLAKYPSVSISSLTKSSQAEMIKSLQKNSKKK